MSVTRLPEMPLFFFEKAKTQNTMGGYIDFFLEMLVAGVPAAAKTRGSKASLVIRNIVGVLEKLKAFLIGGHIRQFLDTFADFVKGDLNIRTAIRHSPDIAHTLEDAWELLVKMVHDAVKSLHAEQSKDSIREALEKTRGVLNDELSAIQRKKKGKAMTRADRR